MIKSKINELLKCIFNSSEFKFLYNIPYSKHIPYQNYIGVNFDSENILSVKLYFSFFEKPSPEIINAFLPNKSLYSKYIDFYKEDKGRTIENNGLTLTLKIDSRFEIKKGYHFRIDKNLIDFPLIKSFKCNFEDILNIGICEEFGNKDIVKYYYYFQKEYNKERFAERFDRPHSIKADLIEYTESEMFNKLITCNLSENKFYTKFIKYKSNLAVDVNDFFLKYNFSGDIAHGFYENNDIEAKYYFNLKQSSSMSDSFLKHENLHINTIGPLLQDFK